MDTAVVVVFVAISLVIICSGIRWIFSIGRLLIRLAWRILKVIGIVLFFPVGLIMKVLKI